MQKSIKSRTNIAELLQQAAAVSSPILELNYAIQYLHGLHTHCVVYALLNFMAITKFSGVPWWSEIGLYLYVWIYINIYNFL